MISVCFVIGFLIKDWKRQVPVRFRFRHELIVVWGCGGASEVCVACILCVVGRRSVGTSGNSVEERDRKGENGSVGKNVKRETEKGESGKRIVSNRYTLVKIRGGYMYHDECSQHRPENALCYQTFHYERTFHCERTGLKMHCATRPYLPDSV